MRPGPEDPADARRLLARYEAARARRGAWEAHWRECYEYALPQSASDGRGGGGERRADALYDGTAPDAAEQLAASLLAELTPPWSRWFGLVPGPDVSDADRGRLSPVLERATRTLQAHFDRSNLAVELHQCYLDLVVAGTACLQFDEAAPGEPSAFRFAAVPLAEAVLEEGPSGRLDAVFRRARPTAAETVRRFGRAALPAALLEAADRGEDEPRADLLEAVLPEGAGYRYAAVLAGPGEPARLAAARLARTPFVAFRWLKAAGESYGRSPVMKALPDIKTANKVVELVLRNASIAVTGIWQADDDGVLNPAAIRLVPGAVIPKAVGSAGLTPLAAPGRFDVSQLVLDDLRARIRHALLADRLGPVAGARMTATEVLERSTEMARLLGATYGRLQGELLQPLVLRGLAVLARRGEVPDLAVDGRFVDLQHRSPLAQAQGRRDVQSVLRWLETVQALGPEGAAAVDPAAAARWLARAFAVPGELVRAEDAAQEAALAVPLPTPDP